MITASIVFYNTTPAETDRSVRSILSANPDKVFLIDHSPHPLEALKKWAHQDHIELHRHPNRGYGAGHNLALAKAAALGGDYHVILNPDVYWEGDPIRQMEFYMEKHPDVGLMLPKVLYPDGRLQYVCRLLPTPMDLIANRLPAFLVRKRRERYSLKDSRYDHTMNVPFLHGCFMMLRMNALKTTGTFDERYFLYLEDTDLCRRIHRNFKTLYYPDATIYHAHAAASHTNLRMLYIHAKNAIKYFNKWGWFSDSERRQMNARLLKSIQES